MKKISSKNSAFTVIKNNPITYIVIILIIVFFNILLWFSPIGILLIGFSYYLYNDLGIVGKIILFILAFLYIDMIFALPIMFLKED